MLKVYTIKEVAELLGVNAQTIRRAIHAGKLKAKKTSENGVYRITENSLNEYIGK